MEMEILPEPGAMRRRMPSTRELWSPGTVDRLEQSVLIRALDTGECDQMTDSEWERYLRRQKTRRCR
jgi:hypothetical protein